MKTARPAAAVRHWPARALGDSGHWGHGSKAGTGLHYRGTECRPKGRRPALACTGGTECRPKAGTGARSARPKAGTGLHWGTECRPKACTGARSALPKAGIGLHWGHVGVLGCRPKAGACWAEGTALRRAQCARGAVSSALCTARGSAVCAPYMYYHIYTANCYTIVYI